MGLIFPLITFPYASRILLPEGIGKVNFANSIISYFAIISSLGIATYGTREVSKVRDNEYLLAKITKELLLINIISTIIAYLFFIVSFLLIPKFSDYKVLLVICSTTLLLNTLGINWLYNGLEEYEYIAIRSMVFQFISLIFLFIFVKTKNDYVKYAAIGIFSSAGSNICNIIHSKKFINYRKSIKYDIAIHIKPILILFASSLAVSVFTILDTSMLGFLSTDIQIGYYSAASKITRMIRDIFPAIFTVLFARLSLYSSKGEKNKIIDLTNETMNFILCFSIPIVCGINILSKPLILLLCGYDYMPAIKTLNSLSPLIIISSCSGYLGGQLLISQGKEFYYLITVTISAIMDIILNLILINRFGAFGAGLATFITELLIFIIYLFMVRNIMKKINIIAPLFQYLISSIFMSVTVYFISRIFNSTIPKLLISTISGIIVYFVLLLLFKNNFIIKLLQIIHIIKK